MIRFFFFDGTIFKVFIEFVTILLLRFIFWPQGIWAISAPQTEIKPAPPVLQHKGLTTGLPRKSLKLL